MKAAVGPLEQLTAELRQAVDGGWLPPSEKLTRWCALAEQALAEHGTMWLSEPGFRAYSGRSAWWCRSHFDEYLGMGLARRRGKRREWDRRASPPVESANEEDVVREIVSSYEQGAA